MMFICASVCVCEVETDSARHLGGKKKAIKKETGAFYGDGMCIKWIALKNGKKKRKETENNKQKIESKKGTEAGSREDSKGEERRGKERCL